MPDSPAMTANRSVPVALVLDGGVAGIKAGSGPGVGTPEQTLREAALSLEPIAGLEDPPYGEETQGQEQERHRQAHADAHVGGFEEAPAKSADQIDHGIEQGDRLPDRGQHADGVK